MRYAFAGMTMMAVFCMVLAGAAAAASWVEYSYQGDGFAISAPSKPSLEKNTVPLASATLEMHTYSVKLGEAGVLSVVVTMLAGNDRRDAERLIADFKRFARLGLSTTGRSDSPLSLAGNPGLQMEDTTATDRLSRRYFVVGRKTYQVFVSMPLKQPRSAETKQFLDSFRLIVR